MQSLGVLAIKAIALWRPFTVFGAYGFEIFLVSLIIWLPLSIFAVKFLCSKLHSISERKLRIFFLLLSISFTMSLLLTQTQVRHRVAFAEPFYWIFALHALEIYLRRRGNLSFRNRSLTKTKAL
jgi:hypothetical protein